MDLVDPGEWSAEPGGEVPPPPWETTEVDEPPAPVSLTLHSKRLVAISLVGHPLVPIVLLLIAWRAPNPGPVPLFAGLTALVAAVSILLTVRNMGLPGRPFAVIDPTSLRWTFPFGRRPASIDGFADLYISKPTLRDRSHSLHRASDGRRLVNLQAIRRSDVRALGIAITVAAYHREQRPPG